MISAETTYRLSGKMPFRAILPKRVRDRLYMGFIRELTCTWQANMRSEEIYKTASIRCYPDAPLRLWIVTSRADVTMALWCLKSLLYYSGEAWAVTLADSGNLTLAQKQALEHHFPGIRILSREALDEASAAALRSYPVSTWLRHVRNYPPSLKLFDPLFHMSAGPFLLVDSDILFFRKPDELIDILKQPTDSTKKFFFNMEMQGTINSGLGVIVPELFKVTDIERILSGMTKGQLRGWTTEQDVYTALASGRYEGLPPDYAVQPVDASTHARLATCHYIGVCRHRFFEQGIRRLRSQAFMGLSE